MWLSSMQSCFMKYSSTAGNASCGAKKIKMAIFNSKKKCNILRKQSDFKIPN